MVHYDTCFLYVLYIYVLLAADFATDVWRVLRPYMAVFATIDGRIFRRINGGFCDHLGNFRLVQPFLTPNIYR